MMCAKNCVLPPLPSLVPSLSTPAARISLIPNRCRVMTLARLSLLSSVPFYVRQMSCKKLRDTEESTGASVSFSQLSACRPLIFVCLYTSIRAPLSKYARAKRLLPSSFRFFSSATSDEPRVLEESMEDTLPSPPLHGERN